jgi:DNA-binding beta-propeller fold protein YncE
VPVGNTGSVDVYEIDTRTMTRVDGFTTAERDSHGVKRTMGPSAVSVGEKYAFVGNRATGEVCSVDTSSLKKGACIRIAGGTDGVAYVASAKEVWVTSPRDNLVVVLDASRAPALTTKTSVRVDGSPEGYAMDESRAFFFTNLEDKNQTLAIDLATHAVTSRWTLSCADGPRGLAADLERRFVLVACTDRLLVLDAANDGKTIASLPLGDGIDNIDWLASKRLAYVASGKTGQLSVVAVDTSGQPSVVASAATAAGARNVVVDATGNAYVADPQNARLLVAAFSP